MYPVVDNRSFSALARYCTNKEAKYTKRLLTKVWNREALNTMMLITSSADIDELAQWLSGSDIQNKLSLINNNQPI